jgi:hypothetical protein
MSRSKWEKHRSRKTDGRFARLPRRFLTSDAIASLSNLAFRILVVAAAEFNGHNNGDISLARPILAQYGIARSGAVQKGIEVLKERGLLIRTRQGGLGQCSLYALAWEPLTEKHGKLDRPLPKLPDTRFLWWQENRITGAPEVQARNHRGSFGADEAA